MCEQEIHTLISFPARQEPGPENQTRVPAAGDILYFHFPSGTRVPPDTKELDISGRGLVGPEVFYNRNNLLLSPSEGPAPGNHFAVIVKNQEGIREAGHSVWREGFVGERLVCGRLEGDALREWGLGEDGKGRMRLLEHSESSSAAGHPREC